MSHTLPKACSVCGCEIGKAWWEGGPWPSGGPLCPGCHDAWLKEFETSPTDPGPRPPVTEVLVDLELLGKLAAGEGGQRTGALKRLGFLEWRVTHAGRTALGLEPLATPPWSSSNCPWCDAKGCPLCP